MEVAWFGAPCGVDIFGVKRYRETRDLRCFRGNCSVDVSKCKSGHCEDWAPEVAGAGRDWTESHSLVGRAIIY